MSENIKISKKELDELRDAQAKLNALEAGGVDNWEWYDKSLEAYHAQKALEDDIHALVDEICLAACENAEEPAGRGFGFGVRLSGQVRIEELIKDFLKARNS